MHQLQIFALILKTSNIAIKDYIEEVQVAKVRVLNTKDLAILRVIAEDAASLCDTLTQVI